MYRRITLALLACAGLLLIGAGKRGQGAPVLISFHLETTADEFPDFAQAVKMGDQAQQFYFSKLPLVTDADVAWFYPFLADDGATYGVAFKLSRKGTDIIAQASTTPSNQGKLIAANIQAISRKQGSIRSYIQIDRGSTDGVLVIWKGLTDQHLRIFSERFPHVRDLME
ncbi:MAG: hypothetical protein ACI8UO_000968 [Verrucomicrobiales bacterium]|jgi:hypothetical protein